MMKILFVCNSNTKRSPTFESYFEKAYSAFTVRSAATALGLPKRINSALADWADRIFVMDMEQMIHIHKNFDWCIPKTRMIGISDEFEPDEPSLVSQIVFWDKNYFQEHYQEWLNEKDKY